jgi:RNA polymerase sigma-70 factor (ECF subfamily)
VTAQRPDEAELVARAKLGDRDAFSALVVEHASAVLTVAWRMLGDRFAAEDAAQETFLAAFQSLATFRGDARFSTWLYRIVLNKCRDVLRARTSQPRTMDDMTDGRESVPEPAGDLPTPEAQLLADEHARSVWRAIRELPYIYREAFVLRHVEGMSYDDISDVLGVDDGALRMRVYKARRELSRRLAGLVVM